MIARTGSRLVRVGSVLLALALFVLFTVGWSSCQGGQKESTEQSRESGYDFRDEGEIPPLTEAADTVAEADVEEMPVEEQDLDAEDVEAPKDTARVTGSVGAKPTDAAPEGGPGRVAGKDGGYALPQFRVQILATSDEHGARDAKQTAEKRLKFPVYISLIDGFYKVRVGDCNTRPEAEKVKRACQDAGYPDAWIVTDVRKGND